MTSMTNDDEDDDEDDHDCNEDDNEVDDDYDGNGNTEEKRSKKTEDQSIKKSTTCFEEQRPMNRSHGIRYSG